MRGTFPNHTTIGINLELTVNNFFTHLAIHPLDAKSKTNKIVSMIASGALMLLSAGLLHLSLFLHECCFKAKPIHPSNPPHGYIFHPDVKNHLDILFKKSRSLTLETLPVVLLKSHDKDLIEKTIQKPIMLVLSEVHGGCALSFRVKLAMNSKNKDRFTKLFGGLHIPNHEIICLSQYKPLQTRVVGYKSSEFYFEYNWRQVSLRNKAIFFHNDIIVGTGDLNPAEKDNLKNFSSLISKGRATDLNGLEWVLDS